MTDVSRAESTPAAPLDHESYLALRHFANLDGLRFLCIVMVLWHHAPIWKDSGITLLGRGFLGVDFFFVLSGFLITTLLLREARRFGDFSLRDFYLRRLLRIVPVYVFVVAGVSAYYIAVKGQHDYLRLVPFYLLFLSNYLTEHIPTLAITWSLAVEEQYYLIWPLLLTVLPRRFVVPVLVGLIALSVLVAAGVVPQTEVRIGPLAIPVPVQIFSAILMGTLAAVVLDRPAGFERLAPVLGQPWAAPVLLAALVAVLALAPAVLRGWPEFAIHLLMTLSLIALVLAPRSPLGALLQARPVARVGVVSYGIYLYHLLARDVTERIPGIDWASQPWISFALYCLMSWAMAELSFRTIEALFRRFRPAPRSASRPARG